MRSDGENGMINALRLVVVIMYVIETDSAMHLEHRAKKNTVG
jgi:hypothetical protein